MAKRFIVFWQFLHYVIYSLLRSSQRAVNRVFSFANHIGFAKRLWARRGVHGGKDIKKKIDSWTTDPKRSYISIEAGVYTGSLSGILIFTMLIFVVGALGLDVGNVVGEHYLVHALWIVVVSGVFNYYILFKGDRYLSDFARFEKIPPRKLRMYKLLTCLFIVCIPILFCISLVVTR